MGKLSVADRRTYIDSRLNADWGWNNYVKGVKGWSIREILAAVQRAYGKENVPTNAMTIKRDIDILRGASEQPDVEQISEARLLLAPERFPEWRATFFRVPETGEPFLTPDFQHAIFWVMHAATFKVELPQWVIDLLDELDPKHPFPEDINELILNNSEKKNFLSFLLLMAPRHGKTELIVHFVLHSFALDPNKRIMFGNGTQKKSEGFINNAIMTMMEGDDPLSAKFVDMYGPFRADNRAWSKQGFTLAGRTYMNKMFSMQPFGISGNIRSFDSDAIMGDDLTDLGRSRSETVTEEDYSWLTTELMGRREYHTSLVLVGSHVASQTGDLFSRVLNNIDKLNVGRSRFIVKTIPAHFYEKCDPVGDPDHTKCILWPDVRDYGFLEAKRAETDDDAMYEAVYNQIPQSKSMLHFPAETLRAKFIYPDANADGVHPPPKRSDTEDIIGVLDYRRSWKQTPVVCCGRPTVVGLGFDPAASERKGASYSAVRVNSICLRCARRYAIDWHHERISPEQHPALLEPFFNEYRPEIVTFEINAYQKALARDPRISAMETQYGFAIKEYTTDERKHDPDFGIPQHGRHFKSGMYSIPFATIADQEFAEPLLKSYIRWPQKPNDDIMADWLCDLGLRDLLEDSRYINAEVMPGSEKWATDWHDEQTITFDLSDAEPTEWEYV